MTACTRSHRRTGPGPHRIGSKGGSSSIDESSAAEIRCGPTTLVSPDRVVSTVMFVDIVSSTERVAAMGDQPWLRLLERLLAGLGREVERHGGVVAKHTGDGLAATFDGATHAILAAVASNAVARRYGVEVRCGLHTGEIEGTPHDIGGLAVHIAQRVSDCAPPGAVLMSRTTADVVAGSSLLLSHYGSAHLRGVPGEWELFTPATAHADTSPIAPSTRLDLVAAHRDEPVVRATGQSGE